MRKETKKETNISDKDFFTPSKTLELMNHIRKSQQERESEAIIQQLNDILKGGDIIIENFSLNAISY